MTRSMFGNNYFALSGLGFSGFATHRASPCVGILRPFRAIRLIKPQKSAIYQRSVQSIDNQPRRGGIYERWVQSIELEAIEQNKPRRGAIQMLWDSHL